MLQLYVFVNLLRNQSWVNLLFSVRWDLILDLILDSLCLILDFRFSIRAGIENRKLHRESRLTTDCQLTFEQYCNCLNGWFTDGIIFFLINWVAWFITDRLTVWMVDWLTGKLLNLLINWLAHFFNGWQVDWWTDWHLLM